MAYKTSKNKFDLENLRNGKSSSWGWGRKVLLIILLLLIISFLGVFVIFPTAVGFSIELQRFLLFKPGDFLPKNLTFKNVEEQVKGSKNFYVTVNEEKNITYGGLQLLPEALINDSVENKNFDYETALNQSTFPVLLHFHGTGGNRFTNIKSLSQLRKVFHVIAFDYRSYGESTEAELTEEGFTQDCIAMYKWLRLRTNPDNIYIWGHSLGAAIATRTLADLYDLQYHVKGLVLEAPFTSIKDELKVHPLSKIFSWVPWFEVTVQDGYDRSKIIWKTTDNIARVDCPVMILHAEDDDLIPYELGVKLNKIANEKRTSSQGKVTLKTFPGKLELLHIYLYKSPEFLNYLRTFVEECEDYNRKITNRTSNAKDILL